MPTPSSMVDQKFSLWVEIFSREKKFLHLEKKSQRKRKSLALKEKVSWRKKKSRAERKILAIKVKVQRSKNVSRRQKNVSRGKKLSHSEKKFLPTKQEKNQKQ